MLFTCTPLDLLTRNKAPKFYVEGSTEKEALEEAKKHTALSVFERWSIEVYPVKTVQKAFKNVKEKYKN